MDHRGGRAPTKVIGQVRAEGATLWGHPQGLFYLAFTEACERFSFYGMTALVVLYMVNHLLLPGQVEQVAGFAAFRAALESVFGPVLICGKWLSMRLAGGGTEQPLRPSAMTLEVER